MNQKKKDPIDHLDDVDVFVDSRGMTKEDEKAISAYIKKEKGKSRVATKSKRKRAA